MPQSYPNRRYSSGLNSSKEVFSISMAFRRLSLWKKVAAGSVLGILVVYMYTHLTHRSNLATDDVISLETDRSATQENNDIRSAADQILPKPVRAKNVFNSEQEFELNNMNNLNNMLMRTAHTDTAQSKAEALAANAYTIDIPSLPRKPTVGPMITPAANPCSTAATQENLLTDRYTLIMLVHGWTKWEQFIRDITPRDAPRLEQVLLLWNNEEDVIPEGLSNQTLRVDGPMVSVMKMPGNSMNNRFVPWRELRTAAVYIVDLDIRLPGSAYEFAFDNWLENQNSLVGYAYRKFAADGTYPPFARPRIFGPDPGYNMVLTGSAMMPTKLLRQYTCEVGTRGIRNMVDDLFNGDDIAMNLLAIHNGALPVALTRNAPESEDPELDAAKKGCLYNLGVNGRIALRKKYSSKNISTRPGHGDKRKEMYRRICQHLALSPYLPLLQTFKQAPKDVDLCTMPEY